MKRILAPALFLVLLFAPLAFADTLPAYVQLADAPSITVDWSKGKTQAVTLHGNRTVVFTNGQKGAKYTLIIKQDATGSRTVTWPSSVNWPGGTGPTLTTTANKKDYLALFFDGESYDGLGMTGNL